MTFEISDEKRRHYKERLAHYLRSHRERHGLTQQDISTILGYSLEHYKRLEGANEERIANTIELLMSFASLDFANVIDFLIYLENAPAAIRDRSLYPWEQSLLAGFNDLKSETRREFTANYCGDKPKGPWNLAELVNFSKKMSQLGDVERMVIELLISRLTKAEFSEAERTNLLKFLSALEI